MRTCVYNILEGIRAIIIIQLSTNINCLVSKVLKIPSSLRMLKKLTVKSKGLMFMEHNYYFPLKRNDICIIYVNYKTDLFQKCLKNTTKFFSAISFLYGLFSFFSPQRLKL